MFINANTAIATGEILLVPYQAKHVPTYHGWMQDEEIQQATASEPLSLEQEFAMQLSWRHDSDKLTFIICRPLLSYQNQANASHDTPESLVGDINLFLFRSDDNKTVIGEVEVMIAEKSLRGKGLGRASMVAFLQYIVQHEQEIVDEFRGQQAAEPVNLGYLRARVGQSNHRSLSLFEAVGFKRLSHEANIFGELELRSEGRLADFLEDALRTFPSGMYHEVEYSPH